MGTEVGIFQVPDPPNFSVHSACEKNLSPTPPHFLPASSPPATPLSLHPDMSWGPLPLLCGNQLA